MFSGCKTPTTTHYHTPSSSLMSPVIHKPTNRQALRPTHTKPSRNTHTLTHLPTHTDLPAHTRPSAPVDQREWNRQITLDLSDKVTALTAINDACRRRLGRLAARACKPEVNGAVWRHWGWRWCLHYLCTICRVVWRLQRGKLFVCLFCLYVGALRLNNS